MSVKRQATTDLNHENWDQDDPADPEEETGGFKMASKEVLEKRVIRTAKRRTQVTGDEPRKSVFSGFTGFNKTQQTSFDFLSKLTNGNNAAKSSSETSATSNPLMSVANSSPMPGLGSMSGTSTPLAKSTFGKPSTESSLFGGTTTNSGFGQSVFTPSKTSATGAENPFKIQTPQSPTLSTGSTLNTGSTSINTEKPTPQIPTNIFGSQTSSNTTKTLFATTNNNSSPFKTQPAFSSQPSEPVKTSNKSDVQDDKKLVYYNKLKGLNESVSEWIKKHVEETPLCILTPIFRDYEKYLKEIQDEFEKSKGNAKENNTSDNNKNTEVVTTSSGATAATSSSLFSTSSSPIFSNNKNSVASPEKKAGFSMGIISSSSNVLTSNSATVSPPSTGFSFGIKSSTANPLFGIKTANKTSPFASSTTTTNTNGSTPFSFGTGKPFTFNSNIQKTEETPKDGEENEDEPPKVEYNPIIEENSVFDKKCKVFVKKDGNFVDKGVGTLYIKKVEETGKHQLLVRANSALGNILLNLILSSSVPTQRMGKNNVMMVCIPTPEAKPPPTSILIRVKSSEEADELLETLNKYKA